MTIARDIRDETLRHKLGLARWEQGLVHQVIGLLNDADADLERRIALAVDRHLSDDTITRLRRIRQELRAVNAEAFDVVGKALSSELSEAAERTAARYAEIMASKIPFDWSFERPSPNLLRSIVTSQPFQGALLKDHVEKVAGNRLDALTRAIQIGLTQSESLSRLLQRVRGTRAGAYRDGVLDLGRRQTVAITRTAAQHVTEEAREQLFRENADIVRGRMWTTTLDHRTCVRFCQPRDGLVWRYDSEAGSYVPDGHELEWAGGPGRIHWQCRCTAIPVLGDLQELEDAGVDVEKVGPGERAALENPVPVSVDYPEWLRTQPREIQVAALGTRRADLFRAGKSLEEVWAKRFTVQLAPPMSLADL